MRGARGRRTALAVWLAVAALLLAACSSGERRPRPQQPPTHRACAGVHLDDVRGPRAVVRRGRAGVVPQRRRGVPGAVAADRGPLVRAAGAGADVGGYGLGERLPLAPRLRGPPLPAAARLAAHRPADRVRRPHRSVHRLRPRPTFCRHGGALSRTGTACGSWRATGCGSSTRPGSARRDQVLRVWRLGARCRGRCWSTVGRGGIARRRASADAGRTRWFLRPTSSPRRHELVAGRAADPDQAGAGADHPDGPPGAGHDPRTRAECGRRPRRRPAACW